jgi:hypothetical protein
MRQLHTTHRLFLASLALFVVSLLFSTANVLTVLSAPDQTVSVPDKVGFEGFLADANGDPLADGEHDLVFNIYSDANGATSAWTQSHPDTPVTDGLYAVTFTGPFAAGVFDGDRWLGVAVDGGAVITPLLRITSVPFALNALNVDWSGVPGGYVRQ